MSALFTPSFARCFIKVTSKHSIKKTRLTQISFAQRTSDFLAEIRGSLSETLVSLVQNSR